MQDITIIRRPVRPIFRNILSWRGVPISFVSIIAVEAFIYVIFQVLILENRYLLNWVGLCFSPARESGC